MLKLLCDIESLVVLKYGKHLELVKLDLEKWRVSYKDETGRVIDTTLDMIDGLLVDLDQLEEL